MFDVDALQIFVVLFAKVLRKVNVSSFPLVECPTDVALDWHYLVVAEPEVVLHYPFDLEPEDPVVEASL